MKEAFCKTGFYPADILLPRDADMNKWAVVACDQFTSEPEYWEKADAIVADAQAQAGTLLADAQTKARELLQDAGKKAGELRQVSNDYADDMLRRTEEAITQALREVHTSRESFRSALSGKQS